MVTSGKGRALHLKGLSRLALSLAMPVLVGRGMWLVALQTERRSLWVRHTLQVEISLERLVSDLNNAESSRRGYLLTGEERFLDSYKAGADEVRREVAELSGLTADNPRQRRSLDQIRPLLESQFSYLQSI